MYEWVIITFVDITFDHHAHDIALTVRDLVRQVFDDLQLVRVHFQGISMATVDHDPWRKGGVFQLLLGFFDTLGVVVGSLLTASQDHEASSVTLCFYNRIDAGIGDGKEMMWMLDGVHSVNRNVERTICTILESDWEGQTGSEFAVELRLGGSGANGPETEEVRDVLRGNGVQHLACQRHAEGCEIGEKLSSCTQAFVDVEAVVHVRVVN